MHPKLRVCFAALLALVLALSPALSCADAQIDGFLDGLFAYMAKGGSLLSRPRGAPLYRYASDDSDFVSESYALSSGSEIGYGYSLDEGYESLSWTLPRSFAGSDRVFTLSLRYMFGLSGEEADFIIDALKNSVLDGVAMFENGSMVLNYLVYGSTHTLTIVRFFKQAAFSDTKR